MNFDIFERGMLTHEMPLRTDAVTVARRCAIRPPRYTPSRLPCHPRYSTQSMRPTLLCLTSVHEVFLTARITRTEPLCHPPAERERQVAGVREMSARRQCVGGSAFFHKIPEVFPFCPRQLREMVSHRKLYGLETYET